ncbi:MAG: FecCD family ABC transporter permease [Hyphomicrobiaceae bacterium]
MSNAAPAQRTPSAGLLFAMLGLGTLLAFAVALLIGPTAISPRAVLAALFSDDRDVTALIVREIRLPRALLGLLVGAALGASGAALQGYLRNPLAEPGLVGVSAGGALGAVLAIHTSVAAAFALALPLAGLAGAALAVLIVVTLGGARSGPLSLILAGVAVSSVAGALTALVLNLSRNPFAAVEMVFWTMGSLADRSLVHVALAGPIILLGLGLLMLIGRPLEALTLGEDVARNLGVDMGRLRWLVIAGTALSVGAATSVAGTIGFVGLVVPHLLRPRVGHRPRLLLPASLLGGAILVLVADSILRLITPGGEIRLGVATALLGAPFFVWLVLETRRELTP